MNALLAAVALLLASPPQVPAFEFVEFHDGRYVPVGSGFLAIAGDGLGPAAPAGTLLLVTAAHVLAPPKGTTQRRSIRFRTPPCADGAPARPYEATATASAVVLVWPGLDLAAIPFLQPGQLDPPDPTLLADLRRRAARLEAPAAEDWTRSGDVRLEVVGFHVGNVCGYRNPAFFIASPTWKQEADGLEARTRSTPGADAALARLAFSGSMSETAGLIQYWSLAGPGASGGPVLFLDPAVRVTPEGHPRVIGVHVGGVDVRDSGWAVAIPAALGAPAQTTLGAKAAAWPGCMGAAADPQRWPCYQAPQYGNSVRLTLDGAPTRVRLMAARAAPGALTVSASLGSEVGTSFGGWRSASADPGSVPTDGNATLRLGVGLDYWRPASLQAVGVRLVGGYRWGTYARRYEGPDGRALESVPVRERAFLVELWPAEWSFWRTSRLWPTLGVGARLTMRSPVAAAFPAHLRVSLASLFPTLALTLDAQAALELDGDLSRRYRLVGGGVERLRPTPGVSFGLALGLDWIP